MGSRTRRLRAEMGASSQPGCDKPVRYMRDGKGWCNKYGAHPVESETNRGGSDNIDELERLAKVATPGPWWVMPEQRIAGLGAVSVLGAYIAYGTQGIGSETYDLIEQYNVDTDYAYIAAANPHNIRAFIDRMRKAEAERDAMRPVVDAAKRFRRFLSAPEALYKSEMSAFVYAIDALDGSKEETA